MTYIYTNWSLCGLIVCLQKIYLHAYSIVQTLYRKFENMKLNLNFQKEERGSNQKLLCWNGQSINIFCIKYNNMFFRSSALHATIPAGEFCLNKTLKFYSASFHLHVEA